MVTPSFEEVMAVTNRLTRKSDGLIGLMLLPMILREMNLAFPELKRFAETTPDGEALWIAFRTRQKASQNPDYNLKDYIREVVAA